VTTALGIDIGGTKTAAVVVTDGGVVCGHQIATTPAAAGAAGVVATAVATARRALEAAGVAAVDVAGVGSAGIVDRRGRVRYATSALPGYAGTDLAGDVAAALGVPVVATNDVQAMAHAQLPAIAGGDALVVAIGTGVGGALVRAGRVVVGRTGTAGSIAHLAAGTGGDRPCPCGGRDHLEAVGSGPAIAAAYAAASGIARSVRDIAARAGHDHDAAVVIAEAATTTGRVLGGLVSALDPDIVLIGGGVAEIGNGYLEPLVAALRANALPPVADVEVRLVRFGAYAVAVGAGHHALQWADERQ